MIRVMLGLLIVFGAVGADDFAMESGTEFPPLSQTISLCLLGLALAFWGVVGMQQKAK